MADPTIPTFCCHYYENETRFDVRAIREFNTNTYNGVCLFSSTLGIFGAIIQILPRKTPSRRHWSPLLTQRGRFILGWLAKADLLAALGIFIRSVIWLSNINTIHAGNNTEDSPVHLCVAFAAWIQYFYTSTWMWTLCYAIDIRLILSEIEINQIYYHIVAWTLPAILTISGLSLLYYPDSHCHIDFNLPNILLRILPNYLATYIPIIAIMLINPYIYSSFVKNMENIVIGQTCQLTTKERGLIESLKRKFFAINVAFHVCWMPNLINGILIWATWFKFPITWTTGLWYIMAITNPLQALLNCIVYKGWRSGDRINITWRKRSKVKPVDKQETTPLLEHNHSKTINVHKTYTST